MSWWSSTVSNLKQTGAQLKHGTSDLLSKGKEVAQKTKEAAKKQLGRYNDVEDLERALEAKVEGAKTAIQLGEIHREWLLKIAQKDGSTYSYGDKQLNFRQALLKSRALEISVQLICGDRQLRKEYNESPNELIETNNPCHHWYTLLNSLLACPQTVWRGLWQTLMSQEWFSTVHVKWAATIINLCKHDWEDEVFHAERKELAVHAEQLRTEIRNIKTADPSLSEAEQEKRHHRKVHASKEMVHLYKTLRLNMEQAVVHREKHFKHRNAELELMKSQMESHKAELLSTQTSQCEKSKDLQSELEKAAEGIHGQLTTMEGSRKEIDERIEELELTKRNLKMQLEEVTNQLILARGEQRKHMQSVDNARASLQQATVDFKSRITTEEGHIQQAETDKSICDEIQKIIGATETDVTGALEKQISDLSRKREQFDAHFIEVLKDHCRFEIDRLIQVGTTARESSAALQNVFQAKGEPFAHEIINERHNFAKSCTDVDKVWGDVLSFQKEHHEFVSHVSEDMEKLTALYRELKEVLAPGMELMKRLSLAPRAPPKSPLARGSSFERQKSMEDASTATTATASSRPPPPPIVTSPSPPESGTPPTPPQGISPREPATEAPQAPAPGGAPQAPAPPGEFAPPARQPSAGGETSAQAPQPLGPGQPQQPQSAPTRPAQPQTQAAQPPVAPSQPAQPPASQGQQVRPPASPGQPAQPTTALGQPVQARGSSGQPGQPSSPGQAVPPPSPGQPGQPLSGQAIRPPSPGQQMRPPTPGQPGLPPASTGQQVRPPTPGQPGQPPASPAQQVRPPTPGQPGQPPASPAQQVRPPTPGQPGHPPTSPGQQVRPPIPGQPGQPPASPGQQVRPPPGQLGQPPTSPGQQVLPLTPGQPGQPPTSLGQQVLPLTPGQPGQPPTSPGQQVRPPTPGQPGQPPASPSQQVLPPTPGQPGQPPSPSQQVRPPIPGQPGQPPTSPGQQVRPPASPGQPVRPPVSTGQPAQAPTTPGAPGGAPVRPPSSPNIGMPPAPTGAQPAPASPQAPGAATTTTQSPSAPPPAAVEKKLSEDVDDPFSIE